MANHRNRFPARRRFLKASTALTASVVALPLPQLAHAAPDDKGRDATPTDRSRTQVPTARPRRQNKR